MDTVKIVGSSSQSIQQYLSIIMTKFNQIFLPDELPEQNLLGKEIVLTFSQNFHPNFSAILSALEEVFEQNNIQEKLVVTFLQTTSIHSQTQRSCVWTCSGGRCGFVC